MSLPSIHHETVFGVSHGTLMRHGKVPNSGEDVWDSITPVNKLSPSVVPTVYCAVCRVTSLFNSPQAAKPPHA